MPFPHITEFFMSSILTGLVRVDHTLQKQSLPATFAAVNNTRMSILQILVPIWLLPQDSYGVLHNFLWEPPAPPIAVSYIHI